MIRPDYKAKYDHYNRVEPAQMVLANPGREPLCVLNGVDAATVSLTLRSNNTHELTFTVYKYVDGELSNGYEWIEEQMEIYCDGIWFNINNPPEVVNDSYNEQKNITAESDDVKLTQYELINFAINQGSVYSYEMVYKENHDPDSDKYYQVKFYDKSNPELSFLHLVLYHANVPGWQIGYVDYTTPNPIDGKTLLPNEVVNFDIEEQNVFAFLTQEVSQAYRCVFEFDTKNMLINVYRGESIGMDTNILVDFHNVQNMLTITREEPLITVFRVGSDEDINIDYCNPVGGSYIEDLSYFCKEPYMSPELIEKYKAWVKLRDSYIEEYMQVSREYNEMLTVLSEIETRVPDDTMQNNWYQMKPDDLEIAYNDYLMIVKGIESTYVDEAGDFDLEALKNSPDWELYKEIMNYTLPEIIAAMQGRDLVIESEEDIYGTGNLLKNPVPNALGTTWDIIGGNASCVSLRDNQPDYAITSGVKLNSNCGIKQKAVNVVKGTVYCLSCYVKADAGTSFSLMYGISNTKLSSSTQSIPAGSWVRISCYFPTENTYYDVAFQSTSPCIVAGMQLEVGRTPTVFTLCKMSDNEIRSYETEWDLYGITELEAKLEVYENSIQVLTDNGFNEPYENSSQYSDEYHTRMYQKYLDYLELKKQCEAALEQRRAEYEAAKRPELEGRRAAINDLLKYENFGTAQSEYPGFTDEEIFVLESLRVEATYENPNIIITSLDDLSDEVDIQKKLYDDAFEQLYTEAHPQFQYEDTIDNILALPEFKEYNGEFEVNNFIRIAVDDENNYVKLRLTEITYNPCAYDNEIDIVFSSMISYRSKRDDIASLIGSSENHSSRGAIMNAGGMEGFVFSPGLIKSLFSNPSFQSELGGIQVGGAGVHITADTIVAGLITANEGVFDALTADSAFFEHLNANLATLEAADIRDLLAGHAGVGELQAIHLTAENVVIDEAVVKDLIAARISVADLAAHAATAELITLISSDGNPSIAFKDSTQQFYDKEGRVRIQIGQDGNKNFNFIVIGEDGATALFDTNGITRGGIPDNTIVNGMLEDATIQRDKVGFPIVETDENGHISITEVMDGDGKPFGVKFTEFAEDAETRIGGLESTADYLNKQITDKIWESDIVDHLNAYDEETGSAIRDRMSVVEQNLEGITSTVSDMRTDFEEADRTLETRLSTVEQTADGLTTTVEKLGEDLEATSTLAEQTSDKFTWLVKSGESVSSFTLTDKLLELIVEDININGRVKFSGFDQSTQQDLTNLENMRKMVMKWSGGAVSESTYIQGGWIATNTVTTNKLATDAIKSLNFVDKSGNFSSAGTYLNLSDGSIKSKNFAIDKSGNAYFNGSGTFSGSITATSGSIGGCTIVNGVLQVDSAHIKSLNADNIVSGTLNSDRLGDNSIPPTKLSVQYLSAIAVDAGTISAGIIQSKNYTWSSASGVYATTGLQISLNDGYIRAKNFAIDSSGNAYFKGNGSFTGSISASSGSIAGWTITQNSLYHGANTFGTAGTGNAYIGSDGKFSLSDKLKFDGTNLTINGNGTFSGSLSAATGSFSGSVTASGGTIGGWSISDRKIYSGTTPGNCVAMQSIRDDSAYVFAAGAENHDSYKTAPFRVSKNGVMYAKEARIIDGLYARDDIKDRAIKILQTDITELDYGDGDIQQFLNLEFGDVAGKGGKGFSLTILGGEDFNVRSDVVTLNGELHASHESIFYDVATFKKQATFEQNIIEGGQELSEKYAAKNHTHSGSGGTGTMSFDVGNNHLTFGEGSAKDKNYIAYNPENGYLNFHVGTQLNIADSTFHTGKDITCGGSFSCSGGITCNGSISEAGTTLSSKYAALHHGHGGVYAEVSHDHNFIYNHSGNRANKISFEWASPYVEVYVDSTCVYRMQRNT